MPGVVVIFAIAMFALGTDGVHRLNRGGTTAGLTELIIAVAVSLFLYIAEFQPQMLGRWGRQDDN
jgi:hypothetical protein